MTPKPLFIIIIFLPLLFFTGCAEDPQPAKQAPKTASPPAAAKPQPQPQPSARETTWPFVSEAQINGSLAENLTARNFILIFDGSGSMGESDCAGSSRKIDIAKKAVVAWSKSVPSDANLGLYTFHNQGVSTLPLASGSREAFMETIDRIYPGGKTPLAQAMLHAYRAFTEQGRRQLGYGEYTIVVVTDGIANDPEALQKTVDAILARTPIIVYSIGFCIGDQHSLNQPGRTIYTSADNPAQLQEGLQKVLAESEAFDESEFTQ